MFNSFYESLPPITLGKSKIVKFLSAYVLYVVTFVIALSVGTTMIVIQGGQIYDWLFRALILLLLTYMVSKTSYKGFSSLYSAYSNKSFKLTFRALQQLKSGFITQIISSFIFFFYQLVGIIQRGISGNYIGIATVVGFVLFICVCLGIYLGYNQIIKPYQDEVKQKLVEYQKNMANTRGNNNPFANSNPFRRRNEGENSKSSDFGHQWGNAQNEENSIDITDESNKKQNEDIAKSANVPIIDIEDEILDTKIKEEKDVKDDGKSGESTTIDAF